MIKTAKLRIVIFLLKVNKHTFSILITSILIIVPQLSNYFGVTLKY